MLHECAASASRRRAKETHVMGRQPLFRSEAQRLIYRSNCWTNDWLPDNNCRLISIVCRTLKVQQLRLLSARSLTIPNRVFNLVAAYSLGWCYCYCCCWCVNHNGVIASNVELQTVAQCHDEWHPSISFPVRECLLEAIINTNSDSKKEKVTNRKRMDVNSFVLKQYVIVSSFSWFNLV